MGMIRYLGIAALLTILTIPASVSGEKNTVPAVSTSMTNSGAVTNRQTSTVDDLRGLFAAGQYSRAYTVWEKQYNSGITNSLQPGDVLILLYRSNNRKAAETWLKKHPRLETKPGPCRYIVGLLYFEAGQYDLFLYHVITSLETAGERHRRRFREVLHAISLKDYHKALAILNSIEDGPGEHLRQRVGVYLLLLLERTDDAYTRLKKLYADTAVPPPAITRLLFTLALRNKSGEEAVYWGDSLIRRHKKIKKDPVFVNNFCMALTYKMRTRLSPRDRALMTNRILGNVSRLLRLKRDANALHTASHAFEAIGDLQKAIEMIRLCRSLEPSDKSYLNRQKKLEAALKKQIRNSGRNRR